jgi:hypothetical protein
MIDSGEHTMFESQNLLPAQFYPSCPDAARIEPLKKLAFAVLTDAVRVFQTNFGARTTRGIRQFDEAREWLLGPAGHGPFSFENVCYLVEMDPLWLRNLLRRWQAMKRAGQPYRALAQRSPVNHLRTLQLRRPRRRHGG